jgi:hypothetical protein
MGVRHSANLAWHSTNLAWHFINLAWHSQISGGIPQIWARLSTNGLRAVHKFLARHSKNMAMLPQFWRDFSQVWQGIPQLWRGILQKILRGIL